MSSSSLFERSGRLFLSATSSLSIRRSNDQPAKLHRDPHRKPEYTGGLTIPFIGFDFLSFMTISREYYIPIIELRKADGVADESEPQAIELGNGLTSKIVQYHLRDKESASIKCGKVVALKTFIHSSSITKKEAVYESITKEIHILSHPLLYGHPNIIQLHFVGLRKDEAFPVLGMELGSHGSLDHLIRSSWCGLTSTQFQQVRRHITIDIAIGLRAIHKAGFAHGDLKPDNVLVMGHSDDSRRVIVKLADFGGSLLVPGHDGGWPVHYTPLWCAPEVIIKDPDIDWGRADIYSYGLVVGSLWASRQTTGGFGTGLDEPTSCFLSTTVLTTMSKTEELDLFWILKSNVDDTSQKTVTHHLSEILKLTVPDETDRMQVLETLKPTLRPYFWLRPDVEDLCQGLQSLAVRAARDIRQETLFVSNKRSKSDLSSNPFLFDEYPGFPSTLLAYSDDVLNAKRVAKNNSFSN
ncbi:kinase-like domain-containing protein [Xylaria curta]|nr:kinase-like domain-containing protein [Xylaria curta]